MIARKEFDVFCSVVIVAFNPDNRLERSVQILESIDLVAHIIIVDNSTEDNDIINKIKSYNKISVIYLNGNKGIGYAQNVGIEESIKWGYKWVMTLDHDTVVESELFEKYFKYISENNCLDIAILSTDYFEIGSRKLAFNNDMPINVDLTISSGSLINTEVFNQIGKMKENYFIDQVDNEYCYRAIKKGYKILILPGCGMEHRLGNTTCVSLFGKHFYIYEQSPLRTFYRTRNCLYFVREYKDWGLLKTKINSLTKDFVKLWIEDNSGGKLYQFFRGLYHGLIDSI